MEKKKNSKHYIIPPSYFKSRGITPIPVTVPKPLPAKEVKPSEIVTSAENQPESHTNTTESLQVKEPPKIVLNQQTKRLSGLSLSSIRAKKEHQIKQMEVVVDEENLPNDDFTEASLLSFWNQFVEDLQKNGKHNLASILSIDTPKLIGTSIHLEFPNATNKVEVERQQYELLSFLRKSLNNYSIDLAITVNEEKEKQYAFTAQEKFEKLKAKNPNIDLLRKIFDLDL